MFRQLAALQTLQWKRHTTLSKSTLLGKWLSTIFSVIIIGYMLLMGYMVSVLLRENKDTSVLEMLNVIPFFLLSIDILSKFFFKRIKSITFIHYYHLPIKLNTLIDFLLTKEIISAWNCYFLFFLLPLAIRDLMPESGVLPVILLILSFWVLSICASFAVRLFQVIKDEKPWLGYLLPILSAGIFALIGAFGANTLRPVSFMLSQPILTLLEALFLFACLWILNRRMMRRAIYSQLGSEMTQRTAHITSINIFSRIFGNFGVLMDMQIKRTLRCKRMKSTLFSALLFIALGLFWITNETSSYLGSDFIKYFGFMIVIGAFGIMFLQTTGAASSTYFDTLAVKPVSLYKLFLSKYYLHAIISTVLYLIAIPLCLYLKQSIFTLTVFYFLLIGLSYPILMQIGAYYKSRFDLFEQASMNWNGWSFTQTLISLLGIFLPLGLTSGLTRIMPEKTLFIILLTFCAVVVALHPLWIKDICRRFDKKRYAIMNGYRNK